VSYLVTAAWVDGYITGINQYAENAYDISPFESTELLMIVIDEHCRDHPKDPVFGVLLNLFKQLWQPGNTLFIPARRRATGCCDTR